MTNRSSPRAPHRRWESPAADAARRELLMRPMLPRLIDAIGLDATIQLLTARGGTEIEVATSSRLLVSLIGAEAAQKFTQAFWMYERVALPMADKLMAAYRNQELAALSRSESRTALARRYGITVRRVKQLLAELRSAEDSPQRGLF